MVVVGCMCYYVALYAPTVSISLGSLVAFVHSVATSCCIVRKRRGSLSTTLSRNSSLKTNVTKTCVFNRDEMEGRMQ